MNEHFRWASNAKRPAMEYAGLHLAVIATGELVLMDDQKRVIAGVNALNVAANINDLMQVTVEMFVTRPPEPNTP